MGCDHQNKPPSGGFSPTLGCPKSKKQTFWTAPCLLLALGDCFTITGLDGFVFEQW